VSTPMTSSLHILCPACDQVNRVPSARLGEEPQCGHCREPLFRRHPLALSGARFERHLNRSGLPLLVDFWAPWCGPCRSMAPAFEAAAIRLEPGVRLVKVNTDEDQSLAQRFGIRGIPTLVLFQDGRELDRISGAMQTEQLVAWTQQALARRHAG